MASICFVPRAAAPEAIKSLMLKFVEQLHAIERLQPGDLVPGVRPVGMPCMLDDRG